MKVNSILLYLSKEGGGLLWFCSVSHTLLPWVLWLLPVISSLVSLLLFFTLVDILILKGSNDGPLSPVTPVTCQSTHNSSIWTLILLRFTRVQVHRLRALFFDTSVSWGLWTWLSEDSMSSHEESCMYIPLLVSDPFFDGFS